MVSEEFYDHSVSGSDKAEDIFFDDPAQSGHPGRDLPWRNISGSSEEEVPCAMNI